MLETWKIPLHDLGRGLERLSICISRCKIPATKSSHYGAGSVRLLLVLTDNMAVASGIDHLRRARADAGRRYWSNLGKGKGSTFVFYIKARSCDSSGSPISAPKANSRKTTEPLKFLDGPPAKSELAQMFRQPTPTPEWRKLLNILIAEDNLVNQKELSKQLRDLGWKVSVANHGDAALKALKYTAFWCPSTSSEDANTTPDVVLMDIGTPIMDGLTATKEIRGCRLMAPSRIMSPLLRFPQMRDPSRLRRRQMREWYGTST
jgi:Response regulator receiver domain